MSDELLAWSTSVSSGATSPATASPRGFATATAANAAAARQACKDWKGNEGRCSLAGAAESDGRRTEEGAASGVSVSHVFARCVLVEKSLLVESCLEDFS